MRKILIIRFSAIGDIVLTSPIIRCLKLQKGAKVHYLTKAKYYILLESNPYVDKVFKFKNNFQELINDLKNEQYDFIIDLHNNIRSWWIKLHLRCSFSTVVKENLSKYLLIYLNLNFLNNHVVDRYFNSIKKLNIINDNKGLDYFLKSTINVNFNINQSFIAWSIGGSYATKRLSKKQIVKVCQHINIPIVLLGGENEKIMGNQIIKQCDHKSIYNFCGQLSLDESAYLIKYSFLVLSNDTGLMHIAASFKKNIISFWGCTKPSLGFYPYMSNIESVQIVANPTLSPCSKHGDFCRLEKKGCIKSINTDSILCEVNKLLLKS